MKFKKRLSTTVILLAFGIITSLQAQQSIYVEENNGNIDQIPLSEVQKIIFSGTDMVLQKTDASTITWATADVKKYYYDVTTDIKNNEIVNSLDVLIYPNPSNGNFSIKYEVNKTSEIKILLTDITGKIIEVLLSDNKQKGNYTLKWQKRDLPSGTYLIKIMNKNILTTKKLIILK